MDGRELQPYPRIAFQSVGMFVRGQYDIYTAVPFLLIGLGMGTLLALLLAPRPRISAQELMARQRKAKERFADRLERASA